MPGRVVQYQGSRDTYTNRCQALSPLLPVLPAPVSARYLLMLKYCINICTSGNSGAGRDRVHGPW